MKKKCNIKKLEIVDDIRFKNTELKTLNKIKDFTGEQDIKVKYVVEKKPYLEIKKLNCGKRVNIGDYILKDSNGIFYVSTKEAYLKYKEKYKNNK